MPTGLHLKHEVYNVDGSITDADGFVIPNLTNQDDDVTTHRAPKATDPKSQQAGSRCFFLPGVPHEI